MSADEIRRLAEDCEKEARHIDEDAGVAFSNGDLRMKEVFDAISQTERKKASALLDYAAMVERCEEMHDKFCMKFSINSDKAKTNPQFMKVAIRLQDMFDYILKGTTDEET